ncbi:phosphotransferase enzyme family protein [Thelonectria olida]|uniref:Phosphotransferase enzyme family protein n=1 Tax=Thelonectria olida TaxID=1576542 RepID=A0A9P8W1F1_9HYPO|nr:phosphotransferase enzyme family protein [Thelonectria olida]
MPTNQGQRPQQVHGRVGPASLTEEQQHFVRLIRDEDVYRLASSLHNNDPCEYFRPPIVGRHNINFFVQFPNILEVDRWVVRVPLACGEENAKHKLRSEVTTMQLVAQKTTIPMPRVHAFRYGLGDNSYDRPLSSFAIFEYVAGKPLSLAKGPMTMRLFNSLADIYIQLRRLEFPRIGCLAYGPNGIDVNMATTSIEMNRRFLRGLDQSNIVASYHNNNGLRSANNYVAMLLELAYHEFVTEQVHDDECKVQDIMYHLHLFRQYANVWLDPTLDQGPFVLMHGELEPSNILVNEDMNVVAVLDWEFSRVVPLQFFKPPLWFGEHTLARKLGHDPAYQEYLTDFNRFLEVVRTRERLRYGNQLLSDEWERGHVAAGYFVPNSMQSWVDMSGFAWLYIGPTLYPTIPLEERIKSYLDDDPMRKIVSSGKFRAAVPRKTLNKVRTAQMQGNSQVQDSPGSTRENTPGGIEPANRLVWLQGLRRTERNSQEQGSGESTVEDAPASQTPSAVPASQLRWLHYVSQRR